MCKETCLSKQCKKCALKGLRSKEEQLELDFIAEPPIEFEDFCDPFTGTTSHTKTSALNKIVSDLLDTVIMLEEEHGEELNRVLIDDSALHERLGKVEFLLWQTRQKRKVK